VGGTFAFVVTLKIDGTFAAKGLERLARETINAASGIAGKDKGLPIITTPLQNIDPGIAAGPTPIHTGSLTLGANGVTPPSPIEETIK
jgi:hypothetical protein